jgi:uncharacterized protein (UPF0262 family)
MAVKTELLTVKRLGFEEEATATPEQRARCPILVKTGVARRLFALLVSLNQEITVKLSSNGAH